MQYRNGHNLGVSFSLPQVVMVIYHTNDCTIMETGHNVDDLCSIDDDRTIMEIAHNVDDLCSIEMVGISTRNHIKTLRVSFSLPQGVYVIYHTNDCTIMEITLMNYAV